VPGAKNTLSKGKLCLAFLRAWCEGRGMLCLLLMDGLITFVAKYFILIPVVIAGYIFFKLKGNKKQEMLVYLFCLAVLSIVLAKIGAHLFYNPRPYINDGTAPLFAHSGDPNGFPSDHTLLASFLAFGAYKYSKKAGYALMVVAVLIGWARVAAHVHHAVDIIGSLVITTLAYLIVSNMLKNEKVARWLSLNHASKKHHGA
jgi:membrane-associated phospholipid phosphatase